MPPILSSPIRHNRRDSPFSNEQASWVVLKFGELKSVLEVRRAFRREFFPNEPRYVPQLKTFRRLIQRFQGTGATRPITPPGPPEVSEEEVRRVRSFFEDDPDAHVRQAAVSLGISFGKVWRILRKKLKWRPYRLHFGTVLSPSNRESRLAACTFWLQQEEGWFDRIIWTDEKWFALSQAPNKKNSVSWAPVHPHEVIECKKAHGAGVMAWVGIVDGKCLPVHWFEGSVNSATYLEMLMTVMWPAVRASATRRKLWFQQDGAPPHVTPSVMQFLADKFGDRVISRKAEHHWPPYSPDLTCLDFSFWPLAQDEIFRQKPQTISQLKDVVEDFARNMDEDLLRRMARSTRRRAELCCAEQGGHFEHLL